MVVCAGQRSVMSAGGGQCRWQAAAEVARCTGEAGGGGRRGGRGGAAARGVRRQVCAERQQARGASVAVQVAGGKGA